MIGPERGSETRRSQKNMTTTKPNTAAVAPTIRVKRSLIVA